MSAAAVTFADDNAATNWAIEWLHRRGYSITAPRKAALMTQLELRERYAPHLSLAAFHQRIHHAACPVFAAERGPGGRIKLIAPTQALIEFLALPKEPGVLMERRVA